MEIYCVARRKNSRKLNSKIFKTKNPRVSMLSKCAEYRFKFKTSLGKISLLNVLF